MYMNDKFPLFGLLRLLYKAVTHVLVHRIGEEMRRQLDVGIKVLYCDFDDSNVQEKWKLL